MKKMTWIVVAALVVFLAGQACAQTAERKGLMLDLGLGFGQATMEVEFEGISASEDFSGPAADFKLGGFINPQFAIYYMGRAVGYTLEDESGMDADADAVNYLNGAGVTWFMNPEAPSFFLNAGVGVGGLRISYDGATETENGGGITLGVGFEFTKNWTIEGSFMRAKVFSEEGLDIYAQNVAVTVNWLFY